MRQEYIQYQNANQSFEEVAENFVVRRKEFERVMAEIRNYDGYSSFQHTVFVGRRGSGKSTILRRIQAELSMDKALNERYEVVRLAEEQTFIYKLYDLWDYVIREMNVLGYAIQIPDFRDYRDDMKQFSKILHELITDQLKKKKKQLILLLDNIDRILSLGNHHEEASLLRELLINFKEIRIIGGSTVMSEHFWKYDKPFYQFFSIKMLEPLTNQEIKALFNHWSEKRKLPEIKNIMEKSPGKLQSIRMLTDGMPRTMSLFVDILLNQSVNNGYQYLQFIVDKATPIYQERLALISEAQKKVFSELAFFWDAASVEDLIPKCNMEGKLISALLKQLTDIKYVEKIKGKTKNNLYRVEERFFNLWFNMTQGGLQHRAIAKALSDFLESWYDATELNSYCANFALHMSHNKVSQEHIKAMSHALMSSKFIKWDIKRNFYKNLEKSNTINKEDLNDLKSYFSDIDVEIDTAFEQGDYRKAIELLHLSDIDEGKRYFGLGLAYHELQDYIYAEKYYLKAIEKGNVKALNNIANLYADQGKVEYAEKYYLQAIKKGYVKALNNIANLYVGQEKQEQSEALYLQSIERGDVNALNNLANLYADQGKVELAETYYLKAIEKSHVDALINLAILYQEQGKHEEAETYYLQAIDKGDVDALNNLANLYQEQGKQDDAEAYYLQAIDKGHVDALFNLANLYQEQGKHEEAETYYLQAIEKGYVNALNNLLLLKFESGKKAEIKELLNKSIDVINDNWDYLNAEFAAILSLYLGDLDRFNKLYAPYKINGTASSLMLITLLYLKQIHLVHQYFENHIQAKEDFKPLYFAVLHLLENKDQEILRMPPEINEIVMDIVNDVKSKQAFYSIK